MKNSDVNTKLLLYLYLYVTFSGAFRKWIFSGNTIVSNIILTLTLISPFLFYVYAYKYKLNRIVLRYLFLYLGILLMLALNPLNKTYFHGLFGLIIHGGFWVIIFLYLSNKDIFSIEKIINIFLYVSVFQFALAFIQFNSPADSLINKYDRISEGETVALIGDFVRVSGTFSYISGYGCFIFFFASLMLYIIITKSKSLLTSILLSFLGLIGAFVSGSRAVVFAYLLIILIAFISSSSIKQILYTSLIVFISVFFFIFYNISDRFVLLKDSFSAFYERVESTNDSGETEIRVLDPIVEIINFRGSYPLFGGGLGATYQGANAIWGRSDYVLAYEGGYEEEPERIILEGGYFLLFIRILLFLYLIRHLSAPFYYTLPIILLLFFYLPVIFNIYQSIYTFFSFILIDKAYLLKKYI